MSFFEDELTGEHLDESQQEHVPFRALRGMSTSGFAKRGNFSGPGSCPRCGCETKLRDGRRGRFYGCVQWPECNGSRDYVGPASLASARSPESATDLPASEAVEVVPIEEIRLASARAGHRPDVRLQVAALNAALRDQAHEGRTLDVFEALGSIECTFEQVVELRCRLEQAGYLWIRDESDPDHPRALLGW